MATYIIAEAGVNHNGDMDMAMRLIEAAAESGADAVKFQSFNASDLTTADAPTAKYQNLTNKSSTQRELLKGLELSHEEHLLLSRHCQACEIAFLSTAFGVKELNLLLEIGITAIKVASGEITHWPLLTEMSTAAVEKDIPVFLSTGMSTLGEIQSALQLFFKAGVSREKITVLHCLSAYPAPQEEVNLNAITSLRATFGCPVGYSDHTLGIVAPIAAVALGAEVIEKHLTLDKTLPGPDHLSSLEPKEFLSMVTGIRSCEQMLGDGIKRPMKSELDTRLVSRRSLRAARPIKRGELLKGSDLICQRPGDGLTPMKYPEIIGTEAKKDYLKGDSLG